ncbi:MAG: transposase [Pseudomonadota bacterium]
MGEAKRKGELAVRKAAQAIGVETPGGRIQVKWDNRSAATPFGQMAFFVEFLQLTGLYARWREACPLSYRGPHCSKIGDILGTWFLSVLSGHRRYSHITTIRADGVMPGLLGMNRAVSEDTVRRGLMAIEEVPGRQWLQAHLDASVWPLLSAPWILDVDVTVKPLYGHQEGAVVGYNPKKPGRPSHTYHTYQMAGLRLVLGVNVEAGNQSHAKTSLPGLLELIDRLPIDKRPQCVRGDCDFGNDGVMRDLEDRAMPYLFKLKLTKNVKRYLASIFWRDDWENAGQGWEGREGEIQLHGWQRARRIIALRRPLTGDVVLADEAQQLDLAFVACDRPAKRYEYAVLVTDLPHEICTLAQLYRDRADSENAFDELKNQWGWGGYTTQDLKRSRFTAMMVALVYNWWSLFVRLANPETRLEAMTSRPFLLSGVARKTDHAGQQHLTITSMHGKGELAKAMLTRVSRLLHEWKSIAEQLTSASLWQRVCQHITTTVTGFNWLAPPQTTPLHSTQTG